MTETVVRDVARTVAGKSMPGTKPIEPNQAISLLVPFSAVKHLLEKSPPPRRPNRNHPLSHLEREMDAWDAASEQAWATIDDDSLE